MPDALPVDEPVAEEIDVPTAHAMWQADDLIVDVRSPAEYHAGHVAGARNIPLPGAYRLEVPPTPSRARTWTGPGGPTRSLTGPDGAEWHYVLDLAKNTLPPIPDVLGLQTLRPLLTGPCDPVHRKRMPLRQRVGGFDGQDAGRGGAVL